MEVEKQTERLAAREHWKVFGLRGAGVLSHPDEIIDALKQHSVVATQTVDGKLSHYLLSIEQWQTMGLADFDEIYNHSVTEWIRSYLFNKIPPIMGPQDACLVGGRKNATSGFVIIPGNAIKPIMDDVQTRRAEVLGVGKTLTREFFLALDTGKLVFGSRHFPSSMDNESPRVEEFAVAVGPEAIAHVRQAHKSERSDKPDKLPLVALSGTRVELLKSPRMQEDLINSAIFSNGVCTLSRWLNTRNCRTFAIAAGNDNIVQRLRETVPPAETLEVAPV